MLGMEMMLAKMTGMTPEQMAAKVKEFEAFVSGGSQALIDIAEKQNQILSELSALREAQNGPGK